MIIRDKPSAWQLLFILRGSILPRIAPRLATVVALSVAVTALEAADLLHAPPIAALPFSLMGIALSIFSGFRNSACYDRWWEGRKIWGGMVADTRDLVRQAFAYAAHGDPAIARPVANRLIAFVYAYRDRLRNEPLSAAALAPLAAPERIALTDARNVPNLLLRAVSAEIGIWLSQGRITPQIAAMMEERVVALAAALAAGERIRSAPVPYAYSLLLHRTAYLFCLLLPFGLAPAAGAWTPVVVAVVSYTFFGLDALGDELEAPFVRSENGLPLDALARTIEIGVLETLGDTHLPEELRAADFVLT